MDAEENVQIGQGAMLQSLALAMRRKFICENAPRCLKCRNRQVRLVYWLNIPAKWSCRVCKFRFRFEPFKVISDAHRPR